MKKTLKMFNRKKLYNKLHNTLLSSFDNYHLLILSQNTLKLNILQVFKSYKSPQIDVLLPRALSSIDI